MDGTTQDVLRAAPPRQALDWVRSVCAPDGTVRRVRPLTGGMSSAIHTVEVEPAPGEVRTVVLRRWVRPGWERTDPDFTASREARALESVAPLSTATPHVLGLDADGTRSGAPALLMTLLPGRAPGPGLTGDELTSFLEQMAWALAEVHGLDAGRDLAAYRPYNDLSAPRPPARSRRPDLWDRAFRIVAGPPPAARACLIHRDYHFGNTLWENGRLTGIVDWGYASWGPASVDLAHMRWNLVVGYGRPAADAFLAAYCERAGSGFRHHPYWDLRTVVDLAPEPIDSTFGETDIGRLEDYLSDLLADPRTVDR